MNWCDIVELQVQSERKIWHVIVFRCNRTEVLVKITEPGFSFPAVEIPQWERRAENLTAAMRRDWGCDGVCLFTPDHSAEDGEHYEVMECLREEGRKNEMVWKPIRSLTAASFLNTAEFRILEQCLHQSDRYQRDPSSPFARSGWLVELRAWIAEVLRPWRIELAGPFCQYNASPSFSLIRFETNGPAVWFKAAGDPNLREFPITLKLAELFPRFIPEVLGAKPEWNGWLSREVDGDNLSEAKDLRSWVLAATELAMLQIQSIAESHSILEFGAHDLAAKRLLTKVEPFFDLIARLMEEQPKVPPATLRRDESDFLKSQVENALMLLEDFRIPDSLGHLDLNPWNVITSANGCVFVDWAEAYVGSPFFSFEYLIEHFRREVGRNTAFEPQLVQAYRGAWARLFSDEVILEGLDASPLAAAFAYAVGTDAWKDEEKLRDPKIAAYFRSMARRINCEAQRFVERRSHA